MPSPLPLEELGLLCLLEKIETSGEVDGIARYGLLQRGLVTASDPPALTTNGAARLAELRRWRADHADDIELAPVSAGTS